MLQKWFFHNVLLLYVKQHVSNLHIHIKLYKTRNSNILWKINSRNFVANIYTTFVPFDSLFFCEREWTFYTFMFIGKAISSEIFHFRNRHKNEISSYRNWKKIFSLKSLQKDLNSNRINYTGLMLDFILCWIDHHFKLFTRIFGPVHTKSVCVLSSVFKRTIGWNLNTHERRM